MRTNVKDETATPKTLEGAVATRINSEQELRRSVAACLLFEDTFYEDGVDIAQRIRNLSAVVPAEKVASLAREARGRLNLRHAPLWLTLGLVENVRGNPIVADTVANVIQRGDEVAEIVAMYWKDGRKPLSAQLKKGLARAIKKFDEYQIAKYARHDKGEAVKFRDVMRLVHAKPDSEEQNALFGRILRQELAIADTWENEMVAGETGQTKTAEDKRAVFERQLREGKLGYLALLRNLRNMIQADVSGDLIRDAILARRGAQRVLPFRYVAAARAAPQFEPILDQALRAAIAEMEPLPGKTIVLVDVSSSMGARLSGKSDMTRMDAAATLASILPSEDLRIFTFSNALAEVPPRRGMAGVDAVKNSQPHLCTYLGQAVVDVSKHKHDRLIVITDEQSHDRVPDPVVDKAYMINVASYQNGVGYGAWKHIDGFSENVIRYIREIES